MNVEGVVILLVILAAGVILFWVMSRRTAKRQVCPGCHRPRLPGNDTCPHCGTSYGPQARMTRYDRSPSPPLTVAPRLDCVQGPASGQSFPITSSEFHIGRTAGSQLQLEGSLVSRDHALITLQNGQSVLFDRASTNGTWVNAQRIAQHALRPGDQVRIGPYLFVFQVAGATATPPRPVEPVVRVPTPPRGALPSAALGDYVLQDKIGRGGMASVWRGVSRRDGTTVAVKIFHDQITDVYLKAKFQEEIRIGNSLSKPVPHPHIAQVFGGDEIDGQWYMVMEYVDSRSLRDRLQPGQPLPLDQIIAIVGQTCDALSYAHSQRIYHRDIKPENILFSSRDGVKLVDFGIAKVAGNPTMTMAGVIVGTPYYMSYEQAQSDPVDGRSDLYSLGVVLYEMLTGRPPFTGTALTVVQKHLTEAPLPPSHINQAVPPQLETVALRALEKNPKRRFQTAEEMARALGYTVPFSQPGAQPLPVATEAQTGHPAPQVAATGRRPRPRDQSQKPGPARRSAARLVVLHSGRILPLGDGTILLARDALNPEDGLISRQHARVVHHAARYWLEDTGSTNGTFVNDRRIFEPALLQSGDVVRLGRTQMRFETTDG